MLNQIFFRLKIILIVFLIVIMVVGVSITVIHMRRRKKMGKLIYTRDKGLHFFLGIIKTSFFACYLLFNALNTSDTEIKIMELILAIEVSISIFITEYHGKEIRELGIASPLFVYGWEEIAWYYWEEKKERQDEKKYVYLRFRTQNWGFAHEFKWKIPIQDQDYINGIFQKNIVITSKEAAPEVV